MVKLPPYTRPLSAKFVQNVTVPGKYYDGRGSGLHLLVTSTGYKYWQVRITVNGLRRTYGIGPYPSVSLRDARVKARGVRDQARAGHDPFVRRRRAPVLTFREAAEATIELRRMQWSDPDREARVWRRTFERYVHPLLGRMRITDVSTEDVLAVLTRVHSRFPKNVVLVRQRLGAVLKWAVLTGHRTDNPASGDLLAGVFGSVDPDHHRALPFQDVPVALARVRACDAWIGTRLLFEYLVLTAVRTNEARGALWSEMDLDSAMWTVPAERMKMRKQHRVPLSSAVLSLLREARDSPLLSAARHRGRVPDLVFPSQNGRVFYNNALPKLLNGLDIDAVPHGFRSSFADWCAHGDVHPDVRERCLAHVVGDQVVEAYLRHDLYSRRVEVMEAWSQFATSVSPGAS